MKLRPSRLGHDVIPRSVFSLENKVCWNHLSTYPQELSNSWLE